MSPLQKRDFMTLKESFSERTESPYQFDFWCAYVANIALMIGVSIVFRYSDFIYHLGGDEWHLGWITGIGMVGAIIMRFAPGKRNRSIRASRRLDYLLGRLLH